MRKIFLTGTNVPVLPWQQVEPVATSKTPEVKTIFQLMDEFIQRI